VSSNLKRHDRTMPEKKVIRLTGGRKPRPAAPRLVIHKKNEIPEEAVQHETLASSSSPPVPVIEAAAVTIGRDVDTNTPITVTTQQLCSGTYVLGVQGVGKSSLLEQIACQLLEQDESVIVFDPHGQLIDNIIRRMPKGRLADTYHLDLKDREYPFALNVFACANPEDEEERDRTRNQVTHAFEKLWPETQRGVYFKKLLRHIIILLIENPGLTLADVPRLLRDGTYRGRYTDELRNHGSRDFWQYDYNALTSARQITESTPLLTRVDELLAEPVLKRILCQPRSTVDIRSLIENRQNLFVTLPINEEAYSKSAGLVGTMLMSLIYAATFSFADVSEDERPGFSLIVDEFQNFATEDYAKLFSQGRKFQVKQFLAHQYRGQLNDSASDANRDATLSAFTKIVFQVTEPDSRALGSLFVDVEEKRQPVNLAIDILDKLDRHPNPVVKEFAARYVWPLQAGAGDRVGKKRWWIYHTLNDFSASRVQGKELSYEEWRWYMLNHADGLHGYARTNIQKQELLKLVNHPQENRDYVMVPDYPVRDFGAGPVSFNPTTAQEALEVLNKLLYNVQKTRMHCHDIDSPRTTLSAEAYEHYMENVRNIYLFEALFKPLLRFDIWRDALDAAAKSEEQMRQLWQQVERRQPPELPASLERLRRFHRDIELVTDALIQQPIRQGTSGVGPADVAQSLQRLPLRQAYVRIGTDGYAMQTQPLTPGVDPDEEQRRRLQLRQQTRQTLCRRVSTVADVREEPQVRQPPVPTPPEPVQPQDEPVAAGTPLLRRSSPLSS
jgi:hypothetical protein